MKRRLMAAMLAGILVFSNTGAVFAAENAGGSGMAAEASLTEEETQGQNDAADEDGEEAEPAEQESVQEEQQDAAQQEGEAETGRESADENEEGISEESADEEDEKDIEAGSADDAVENDLSEETADDELSEEAAEEAVEEEAAQGETIEEDNISEKDDVEEASAGQGEAAAEDDADVSDDAKEGTADRNAGEDTVRAGAASEEVTVTEEEPEQEEGARAAKGDTDTWEIKIEAEKDDALYVFTDGELEVFVTDLTVPEGTEYSINWYVGHGAWNSENNEFDEWNFGEGSGWTKEDDGRIVLDGAAFIGTDRVEVRASLKCDGEETASAQRTFEVREPYVEDQWQFGDRDMLPGWDQRIDRSQRVYVENSQYPWGEHFEREVTSVDVEDVNGENVVFIENSDENGWNLRAQNMGESRVTVTYTDWDGTEGQTMFRLSVGGDVYGVDLWTDSGSDIALPGKTVSMTAQAWHEQHDHDGETDLSGISYSWNFDGYYGNDDYIDLIKFSQTSGKTTVVSFEDIPADAGDLGINVTVSIYENSEKKAENNYWLHVRGRYFEIWPVLLDSGLDVGGSISPTFEVRSYDVNDVNDYSVLPAEDVKYEWHFDQNAFTITETSGGQTVEIPDGGTSNGSTVNIKRKGDWDTDLAVKAFWQDEHGDNQEVWNHYYFDKKHYDFRFFEHDADLFAEDPAPPVLVLDTGSLGEDWQDRFDLDLAVGHWDRDAFTDLLDKGEEGDYQVSYTDNAVQVALTPSYLAKVAGDESIGHDDVRIAADLYPKGADKTQENRICDTDAWFHIRKAWIEYEREYDRDMLPGWDGTIQGTYNVHMENMEYPDGYDTEYRVTNVEKVRDDPWEGEDGSVITDFHRDQDDNDENDYWWYYRVENHGEATLKVTYEDIDGQKQNYWFTLHVGGDVYSVNIGSDGGARNSLPGGTIELYAAGCHEYYDENGDYQNNAVGLDYDWSFEYGEEFADLTVHADDHSRATLTFKALPEGWDWIDEDVRVAVKVLDQEGHETSAYASEEYAVRSEYTEIWPLELDKALDVGSSITPTFEVRRYPADNDDGYIVLPAEDVQYEWKFDQNELTITEMAGGQTVEIPNGGTSNGNTVSITRMVDWNINLDVRAFWRDKHGNEQDVWNRYHFDDKNYNYEAVLSVPANAVFYAVPGEEYTAEQIFDKISPTLKVIYEVKPEGEPRPISDCWIREVKNGGDSVGLLSPRDDRYAKMFVSGNAPEGEVTLVIGAKEDRGMTAEAECKVMIHNHNATGSTASKATLTADGVIVNTCNVCGERVSTTPISHPSAFTLSQTAYTYTGAACTPAVTVKDAAGKVIAAANYTVAYKNNVNAGTASAVVTFRGNYSGSKTITYKIAPAAGSSFTLSKTEYIYTGAACKPAVTVKDAAGKVIAAANYTVAYKNNVNAGTASAVVTLKGNYSGSKTITFNIAPVAAKTFAIAKKKYVYTGKALKPAVTVKDAAGKVIPAANYTVTFSANKNPGKASVKIVMKGNYSGQKTLNFTINPKKTKLSKPTTDGETVTVKWAKMTKQTTGYQIQYGLKSNFKGAKTKTISKNKTVSAKIKGLKPGKKYYFRIRTYKKVGSKKYVSAWSAKKSITVE